MRIVFLALILLFFSCGTPPSRQYFETKVLTDETDINLGEKLFVANCATCHRIKEKLLGPPLKGVTQTRDKTWLIAFIQNAPQMIESGDPDAVKLWNEYRPALMQPFPQLSEPQIEEILKYVESAE